MITNVEVYGLRESVRGSKFPMTLNPNDCSQVITRNTKAMGNAKAGSGHDQFLTGIIVQFDLRMSIKAWVEAERYHFLDFVSSQSTMHRISQMDIDMQVNEYVTENTIAEVNRLKTEYLADPTSEKYLALLYNVPTGFELTARMTTNYRQLKTIYFQRKDHRLPEWRMFCKWVETLPMFKTLCLGGDTDEAE